MVKKIILLLIILHSIAYSQNNEFARGADIGWLSEMEATGKIFYNDSAKQEDLLQILSDHCINSIRLRVWVNPTNYYCGKQDVVNMAKRVSAMGFRLMIDFHYSDFWADPGQQNKPSQWNSYSVSELSEAIYNHTFDVLNSLKNEGVTPEWVQIGNETNNGLLWNEGKASENMWNYATFITSGNNAAKAVFPNVITIVHLANGFDNELFKWNIGGLISNNAKFDAIGMSLYPDSTNWQSLTEQCLLNMQDMVNRFSKPIIISEIGLSVSYPDDAKKFVEDIILKNQSLGNKGLGVFWWEPQSHNWNGYDKGAWGSNGMPTIALDGFQTNCPQNIDCNGIINGMAFIDNCGKCVGGNTNLLPCYATLIQAENACSFDGSIDNNNHGYTGNGFVNILNNKGSKITWELFSNNAQILNVNVRYANNSTLNRNAKIIVNDNIQIEEQYFPPTGSWTNWQLQSMQINLNEGINTITFESLSNEGGVNYDYLFFDNVDNIKLNCNDEITSQEITINKGWNLISSFINVGNEKILEYFSPLDIGQIAGSEFFWAKNTYLENSNLINIKAGTGYMIYSNSDLTTVTKKGIKIVPSRMFLSQGWNLIGIPVNDTIDINKLPTEILIIKDFNEYYDFQNHEGRLNTLNPGKAYFVKCSKPCFIDWKFIKIMN